MRHILAAAAAFAIFSCATSAGAAMTKQEYRDAKKRIDTEYQAERQKCGERHGNPADLCIARAHGTRDVAKAELESAYKPTPRANYDAAIARAQARYAIAKQECDDSKAGARDACMKDVKAELARAKAEAKALRELP